jgi:hypothetical protein
MKSRLALGAIFGLCSLAATALAQQNEFVPPECASEREFLASEYPYQINVDVPFCSEEGCYGAGSELEQKIIRNTESALLLLSKVSARCSGGEKRCKAYRPEDLAVLRARFLQLIIAQDGPVSRPALGLNLHEVLVQFGNHLPALSPSCNRQLICLTASCANDPDGKDCKVIDMSPFKSQLLSKLQAFDVLYYDILMLTKKLAATASQKARANALWDRWFDLWWQAIALMQAWPEGIAEAYICQP